MLKGVLIVDRASTDIIIADRTGLLAPEHRVLYSGFQTSTNFQITK